MQATITKHEKKGRNLGNDKELVGAYSVIGANDAGELREFVCARSYMGRSRSATVVYASIWVRGGDETAGNGSAGGCGYHKESAAFQSAIDSAAIELSDDAGNRIYIDGRGDSAMRGAFVAIARAAGARGPLCFVAH